MSARADALKSRSALTWRDQIRARGGGLDYDAGGKLVGIDIDNASRKVQLDQLELSGLRSEIKQLAG